MNDNTAFVCAFAIVGLVIFSIAYFVWSADVKADRQCKEMTVAAVQSGREDLIENRVLPTCDWNYRR